MDASKQMQVKDFVYTYVPSKYSSKFMQLMREWDRGPNTSWAFYDIDVLNMKLEEAMESN